MDTGLRMRGRMGLVVVIVATGAILAGCGSGKSSSATSSTSTSQTLRRWELRVTNGSAAQGPAPSFMERLAGLIGWPQIAEAGTGVAGCNVSAPGPGNTIVSDVTDANGKAILDGPLTPGVATVVCNGTTLQVPINGPPGSIIEVEVETNKGSLKVKAETEDASPSEPSISEPSVSENQVSPPSAPSPKS